MKVNKLVAFPLFICVLIWNGLLLISDKRTDSLKIESETRKIYHMLENEILKMDGVIIRRRGRINTSFSMDINFNYSTGYDRIYIFRKIEELGFKIEPEKSSYNSDVFCNRGAGFLIYGNRLLTISYRYKMSYCSP